LPDGRAGHHVVAGTGTTPEVEGKSGVGGRVDTGDLDERAGAAVATSGDLDLSAFDVYADMLAGCKREPVMASILTELIRSNMLDRCMIVN
jgi:hypothetical protein